MTRTTFCLLCVVLFTCASGVAAATDPGRGDSDVRLDWAVEIPMRDGTILNGTLYRPPGDSVPLSTIITITPYISDRYHPDALYFARNGFAFLIVDTRGRGNSQGEFRPLGIEDGLDGHDIVEWVAGQRWSNGKIGLRGGSYGGYNQWATARYFPAHLTSIAPIASPHHGSDFPMDYNVQYLYTIRWLTLTSGVTPQSNLFGDDEFWFNKFRDYHRSGQAYMELDKLVGNPNATFREWASHPAWDDYWAARVPKQEDYARFELPILTITGYYDGDQPGAMEYYRRHMRWGSEKGKNNHYLIIGPWNHSGTRIPQQEFGGIRFGDAMMFDAFQLDRDWYRWTMEDGDKPAFIRDRVTYFVAGANEWKSAPSLEAIADSEQVFYLQSSGAADSLYASGTMREAQPAASDVDEYSYDPLDVSKVMRDIDDNYITNVSELVMTDGDGLIYHSPPFDEATEITGYVRFDAWLETNVPDTDVKVSLYEVLADGSSVFLSSRSMRLRYRDSLSDAKAMTAGEVTPVRFDNFAFFSRRIAEGSRLRLFIRPANDISDQRNYNSGGEVARETAADARTAVVKLHLGPRTPSRLVLPVVSRD